MCYSYCQTSYGDVIHKEHVPRLQFGGSAGDHGVTGLRLLLSLVLGESNLGVHPVELSGDLQNCSVLGLRHVEKHEQSRE